MNRDEDFRRAQSVHRLLCVVVAVLRSWILMRPAQPQFCNERYMAARLSAASNDSRATPKCRHRWKRVRGFMLQSGATPQHIGSAGGCSSDAAASQGNYCQNIPFFNQDTCFG